MRASLPAGRKVCGDCKGYGGSQYPLKGYTDNRPWYVCKSCGGKGHVPDHARTPTAGEATAR